MKKTSTTPKECFIELRKNIFKVGWLNSKRMDLEKYGEYLAKKKIKNNRELNFFIDETSFCKKNDIDVDCGKPCETQEQCLLKCYDVI